MIVECRRRHHITVRLHQLLGSKPPAPEGFVPVMDARSAPQPRPAAPTALAPKAIFHYHINWAS